MQKCEHVHILSARSWPPRRQDMATCTEHPFWGHTCCRDTEVFSGHFWKHWHFFHTCLPPSQWVSTHPLPSVPPHSLVPRCTWLGFCLWRSSYLLELCIVALPFSSDEETQVFPQSEMASYLWRGNGPLHYLNPGLVLKWEHRSHTLQILQQLVVELQLQHHQS